MFMMVVTAVTAVVAKWHGQVVSSDLWPGRNGWLKGIKQRVDPALNCRQKTKISPGLHVALSRVPKACVCFSAKSLRKAKMLRGNFHTRHTNTLA